MPVCPAGHDSATSDYCDVCGAPLAGPSAPPSTTATETCPGCGSPRTGRFCEGCGFDFDTASPAPAVAAAGANAAPAVAAPGSPGAPAGAAPGANAVPVNGADAWTALVVADRAQFDAVVAEGGPDAGQLTFPPYCPPRTFTLTGDQIRVGRRSMSRGIAPEIDLTGPPLDPGISHLHVLLNRMPDGSWQLVDPGSANGTRINDHSIQTNEPVAVADGDQIHIGAWTTITLRKGGTQ